MQQHLLEDISSEVIRHGAKAGKHRIAASKKRLQSQLCECHSSSLKLQTTDKQMQQTVG